jgi:cell division protein FtsL
MHEMSFWELAKSSPEWVAVFANAIFATVTIGVVIWQVCVMKWQGRVSERHERIQNRLIRLQHEHEWLLRLNAERERILDIARKLHLAASCLELRSSDGDRHNWEELQNTVHELSGRLRILDIGAYAGKYDQWFPSLEAYVETVQQVVIEDGTTEPTPSLSTRQALKDADGRYKPIGIFLDLETAIRIEFFEFKTKWESKLPT